MKVRAIATAIVTIGDNPVPYTVREGDAYEHDSDMVRAHPELFERDNVEQATAAPGEKRNVRRG